MLVFRRVGLDGVNGFARRGFSSWPAGGKGNARLGAFTVGKYDAEFEEAALPQCFFLAWHAAFPHL